jgi:hypothetical protein
MKAVDSLFKHEITPGGELWPLEVNFDPKGYIWFLGLNFGPLGRIVAPRDELCSQG